LKVQGTCPENSLYYVALGAAYFADEKKNIRDIADHVFDGSLHASYASLEPLFRDRDEYWKFHLRHAKASVARVPFKDNETVHIGIDSGSTTIKIAVINDNSEILYTRYEPNDGNPIPMVLDTLKMLYDGIRILRSAPSLPQDTGKR